MTVATIVDLPAIAPMAGGRDEGGRGDGVRASCTWGVTVTVTFL